LIGFLLGSGSWVIARDIPSSSFSCLVESLFYWGNLTLNYTVLYSSGWVEYGELIPCPPAGVKKHFRDDLDAAEEVTNGTSFCLKDQWNTRYDLELSSIYIVGTVNHPACDPCPVLGMVRYGVFILYVDIPSGALDSTEGYITVALVSNLKGVYRKNGSGETGMIQFTLCPGSPQKSPFSELSPPSE
jgi:hypothetical protein